MLITLDITRAEADAAVAIAEEMRGHANASSLAGKIARAWLLQAAQVKSDSPFRVRMPAHQATPKKKAKKV